MTHNATSLKPKSRGPAKQKKSTGSDSDDDDSSSKHASWEWDSFKVKVLLSLRAALATDISASWSMGVPEENYFAMFTQTALLILEHAPGREQRLRDLLIELIALPLVKDSAQETQV
jgi:hypothetical protein